MRQGDSIWTLDMVIQVALQQLSVGSMITGCRFLGETASGIPLLPTRSVLKMVGLVYGGMLVHILANEPI